MPHFVELCIVFFSLMVILIHLRYQILCHSGRTHSWYGGSGDFWRTRFDASLYKFVLQKILLTLFTMWCWNSPSLHQDKPEKYLNDAEWWVTSTFLSIFGAPVLIVLAPWFEAIGPRPISLASATPGPSQFPVDPAKLKNSSMDINLGLLYRNGTKTSTQFSLSKVSRVRLRKCPPQNAKGLSAGPCRFWRLTVPFRTTIIRVVC
jgi:hypothetical protein